MTDNRKEPHRTFAAVLGGATGISQCEETASLTPLHKRLQRLLDTIPISAQREGLSLLDLQSCLRGRKGGLPHIGELGAAMRRLGWQRRRAWSNEKSAFSSKWYPAELD